MNAAEIPRRRLEWRNKIRIVSGRLRRESVFEQVAHPEDLALVLEILDSGRRRIPPDDLPPGGPGVSFVLAPFRVPRASRFSDGTFGVLYAASSDAVARAEYGFHLARFLSATREPAQPLTLRRLVLTIRGRLFADIERVASACTDLLDPDPAAYARPQATGRVLREEGVDGIVYPSVRWSFGRCVAVFRPRTVVGCRAAGQLYVEWTGNELAGWAEIRTVD